MNFQEHSQKLQSALKREANYQPIGGRINISEYTGFIKGDVSGIQDFIFSVKSDGASKSLKSRSHFIEILTTVCVQLVQKEFGANNFTLVYDGGGNFYGFLKNYTEGCEQSLQKRIDEALVHEDIYVCLTAVKIDANGYENFGEVWKKAEEESGKDKQKKLKSLNFSNIFGTYSKTALFNSNEFKDFSKELTRAKSVTYNIVNDSKTKIERNYFQIFGCKYALIQEGINQFEGKMTNKLPLQPNKNKDIKDFASLAAEAKMRTGTEKLGILKMDVDNLGELFRGIKDVNYAKGVSQSLSWFFNQHFCTMWEKQTFGNGIKYSDNIYPVFAGGDDCFLVGAWDAVFEFAKLIRQEFKKFAPNISISAGLLVVDEHYPAIRFAKEAESSLKKGKKAKRNQEIRPSKDKIVVFDEVLTWIEFERSYKIAYDLKRLIDAKEPRTILDRIKQSKKAMDKLNDKASEGFIKAREVWRLEYYIHRAKSKQELQNIINQYKASLLKTITTGESENSMLFPVAARWAEFLTRSKSNNNNKF